MKPRGKMWLMHFSVYVFLHFSVGCLAALRGNLCNPACFIKSERGAIQTRNVCTFQYYMTSVCNLEDNMDLSTLGQAEKRPMDLTMLRLKSRAINSANSLVDFTLKVNVTGKMVLMMSGITDRYEDRCLTVCFEKRSLWHLSTLRVACVIIPNGFYSVTVLSYSGTADDVTSCSNVKDNVVTSFRRNVTILSHSKFTLPLSRAGYVYPWDKKRHRTKRFGEDAPFSVMDILQGLEETTVVPGCSSYTCINTHHTYNNKTALLHLSYKVNTTEDCCANYSSLNLVLFRYVWVNKSKECTDLNFTAFVVNGLRRVTQDKNVTHGPVEYPNIGNGCYAFRLQPTVDPSSIPVYHGFFWLRSSGNVTNMNDWNTTFFIEAYPAKRSLEVRWTAPTYPYNFSFYELQLWHHKNSSITCRGDNVSIKPIVVIPTTGKILLASTSYQFQNLSSGWYCARVTPIDDRCPPDGCEPRSSPAKQLTDDFKCCGKEQPSMDIAPILIGAAAGVLLAGVLLACMVLRCRSSHKFFRVTYTKVNQGSRLGEIQQVLLVWTEDGADGAHLFPVIQAFKRLLTSYSRCKIYDYLDLKSIPPQQREHILAAPTAWFDTLLNQHNIKIIVVGTEGGHNRQIQWTTTIRDRSEVASNLNPYDDQLFPYLLRRLQDRPDLAADYARVFHVRFSDISSERAELEGVVSWTRYRLPQHLRSLTLALHGIKEEDGTCLEEPTSEILQDLQNALVSHPLYFGDLTANNNFNTTSLPHSIYCTPLNSYSSSSMQNQPILNHSNISQSVSVPHRKCQKQLLNYIDTSCSKKPQTDNDGITPVKYVENISLTHTSTNRDTTSYNRELRNNTHCESDTSLKDIQSTTCIPITKPQTTRVPTSVISTTPLLESSCQEGKSENFDHMTKPDKANGIIK